MNSVTVSLITTLTESEAHTVAVAGVVVVVSVARVVGITEATAVVVIRRTKKVYRLFPFIRYIIY